MNSLSSLYVIAHTLSSMCPWCLLGKCGSVLPIVFPKQEKAKDMLYRRPMAAQLAPKHYWFATSMLDTFLAHKDSLASMNRRCLQDSRCEGAYQVLGVLGNTNRHKWRPAQPLSLKHLLLGMKISLHLLLARWNRKRLKSPLRVQKT